MQVKQSNYDKFPEITIPGYLGYSGWESIGIELKKSIEAKNEKKVVIVLECYHGVLIPQLISELQTQLGEVTFIPVATAMLDIKTIEEKVYPYVTDDPVFGYMTSLTINDFFNKEKLQSLRNQVQQQDRGIVCVYGIGASLVIPNQDILVYADMPRWEIQLRFRANKISNIGSENIMAAVSYKYKRAFFVDWRVCDRLKKDILPKADYVLDTVVPNIPKMITGKTLQEALAITVQQPFRVVPFFDPGPWGGQWLKEVCDLDRSVTNYAWSFDCVPEENSLLLRFDNVLFETPSINAVFFQPQALLGNAVWQAFGEEFPIRFDFLDTMQGGNLSLQVHPLKEYIQAKFGMNYTQDESYYMMDAAEDAFVYLGLKENIVPDEMLSELQYAQDNNGWFDAEKYVEKWPIKKHDHVLIPAGTVHCSGSNSVVLEISATPYIFTFKLWDWGRMGLDGKPRPISLAHGKHSIQWDRTTNWTKAHIFNQIEKVSEGEGWIEEKTGLHEESFIETRRHWFTGKVSHNTNGVVNVLNLVEGREAIVESPNNAFKPFVIHYAETFIVPASVDSYTIKPYGESEGKTCATLKAFINKKNLLHYHINN